MNAIRTSSRVRMCRRLASGVMNASVMLALPALAAATPLLQIDISDASGLRRPSASGPSDPISFLSADGQQAIAGYGTLGISAQDFSSLDASWRDDFLVTGGEPGTGGTLSLAYHVEGSLKMPSHICTVSCDDYHASFTFTELFGTPSTLEQDILTFANATTRQIDLTGTLDVPFTYGQSFTGGFRLEGSNGLGGSSIDLLHTASITGIFLPDGAQLSSASGTAYPIAESTAPAPVPEPATVALVGIGLACLARFGRR
jgi:hypothetical protein